MSDFFQEGGGGVLPEEKRYVERDAVNQLLEHIEKRDFCYVLTPRQMGKTTLKNAVVAKLRSPEYKTDYAPIILDLDQIGGELGQSNSESAEDIPASSFYYALLTSITDELNLEIDLSEWWDKNSNMGFVHRFTRFLHKVALTTTKPTLVIFIDEIGTVRNLAFDTDDFFAAIRSLYNARGDDAIFKRLTFVLLGTATPNDLIKDPTRTPFNIGYRIDLKDFQPSEVAKWQDYLEDQYPNQGQKILSAVFEWTHGHPALTQKLCAQIDADKTKDWSAETVHSWMNSSVLPKMTKNVDGDHTLGNIQQFTEGLGKVRRKTLGIYNNIHKSYNNQDKKVKDDKVSSEKEQLKMVGLVREKDGFLYVRNKIYYLIFNQDWIKGHTPTNWILRVAVATTIIAVIFAGLFAYSTFVAQPQLEMEAQAQVYEQNFQSSSSSEVRLTSLAGLFELGKKDITYQNQAYDLFAQLTTEEQLALFSLQTPQNVEKQLITVVQATYITLDDTNHNNTLLQTMSTSLNEIENPVTVNMATEIDQWLMGRKYLSEKGYAQAREAYDVAVSLNKKNVMTHYERASILTSLKDYESALQDYEDAIQLNTALASNIRNKIVSNKPLYDTFISNSDKYLNLASVLPTPTPTATFTPIPTNTNTPTPTPTNTNTPIPPTSTATFTPTPTVTLVPPTPTPDIESILHELIKEERSLLSESNRTNDDKYGTYYDITFHNIEFINTVITDTNHALVEVELTRSEQRCIMETQECFANRPIFQYTNTYSVEKIDGKWLIVHISADERWDNRPEWQGQALFEIENFTGTLNVVDLIPAEGTQNKPVTMIVEANSISQIFIAPGKYMWKISNPGGTASAKSLEFTRNPGGVYSGYID